MRRVKKFISTIALVALIGGMLLSLADFDFKNPQKAKADVNPQTIFEDDFSGTTGNGTGGGGDWSPQGGGWNVENGAIKHQDVGRSYTTTSKILYENDFSVANDLVKSTGESTNDWYNPYVTDGYLKFDGEGGTTDNKAKSYVDGGAINELNWTDYTVSLDFQIESTTKYGIVYIRSNENRVGGGNLEYRVLLYNGGSLSLLKYSNDSSVNETRRMNDPGQTETVYSGSRFNGSVTTGYNAFDEALDWKKLIIKVKGSVANIWVFDYDGTDRFIGVGDFEDNILSAEPNLQMKNMSLSAGTIALGQCIGAGDGDTNFDNLQITTDASPVVTPATLYRDGAGTISPSVASVSIDSSADMNGLITTVQSPSGKTWTNTQSGATTPGTPVSLAFPTDFTGSETASLDEMGTYLVTSTLGAEIVSHSSFEVKEKPLSSFVVASDIHLTGSGYTDYTHYTQSGSTEYDYYSDYYEICQAKISSFASDIVSQKNFPTPNSVFLLGDLVEGDDGLAYSTADYVPEALRGTLIPHVTDDLQALKDALDPEDDGKILGTIPYYVLPDGHDFYSTDVDQHQQVESEGHKGETYASVFGADKFNYQFSDDYTDYFVNSVLGDCGGESCTNSHVPGEGTSNFNYDYPEYWANNRNENKNFFEFVHKSATQPRTVGDAAEHYYTEYYEDGVKREALNAIDSFTDAKFKIIISGHSHINSINNVNNSEIVSINNTALENGEYKLVEVYDDRVEVLTYSTNWKYGSNLNYNLSASHTDATHANSKEYVYGLPSERNVVIGDEGTFMNEEDISLAGNENWRNYELTGKINLSDKYVTGRGTINAVAAKQAANEFQQAPNEAGFIVRYTDENNYIHLTMDTGASTNYNHIKLWQKKDGKFTELDSTRTDALPKNTDYYVKITASDSDTVSADVCTDHEYTSCDTVSYGDVGVSAGKFGLASYGDTTFDDVVVTDLGAPNAAALSNPSDDFTTNDTTPTLSWEAATDPEGTTVSYDVYVDGSAVATGLSTTTHTLSNALSDGAHTWYVKAKDTSGHETESSQRSFVVDITGPILTEKTAISTYTNDATPNYAFTSDTAYAISYGGSCGSGNLNEASVGDNSTTYASLAEGLYNDCTVTILDAVGNSSTLYLSPFTVDTTAPALTITSPSDRVSTTAESITISGSVVDANSSGISLTINGTNITNLSNFSATAILTIGDNTITLVARDAAGNEATRTLTVTRRVLAETNSLVDVVSAASGTGESQTNSTVLDNNVPTFTVLDPKTGVSIDINAGSTPTFNTQTPVLRGHTIPYAKIIIEIHSTPFTAETTANENGDWEYRLTSPLDFGEHTVKITIKARDTSETIAEGTYKINIVEKAESKITTTQTKNSGESDYWVWIVVMAVAVIVGAMMTFTRKKVAKMSKK